VNGSPEYIYVIEGKLSNIGRSNGELEHNLVIHHELELEASMIRMIQSDSPCHVFVAAGASIDFVIRTEASRITLERPFMHVCVGSVKLEIHLNSPIDDADIELDGAVRGDVLNESQLDPNAANVISIGIPTSNSRSSVVVPLTKYSLDRVKLGTQQCYGFRGDGQRCENRRRNNDGSTSFIWCHHHEYQRGIFENYMAGIVDERMPEKAGWWIAAGTEEQFRDDL
jgi:hypothetical protein